VTYNSQTTIHLIQHHVTLHIYATDTVPVHNHQFIKFAVKDSSVMYRDMTEGYRPTLHYYNVQIMVIEVTVFNAWYCYFEFAHHPNYDISELSIFRF
jgi:hypothetical protein